PIFTTFNSQALTVTLWRSDGTAAGTVPFQTITVPRDDSFARNFTTLGDTLLFVINDTVHGAEPWVIRPATVQSVVLNDGLAQRSMITRITITFSDAVTIDAGAFRLVRDDGTVVTPQVTTALVDGKTVATLTFSGEGIVGGSLADGHYSLTIVADHIRNVAGTALDGNGDGVARDDRKESFFRLFGDADGDGDVSNADLGRFRAAAENGPDDPLFAAFDFDGDGSLGGAHAWGRSIDFHELIRRMRNNG